MFSCFKDKEFLHKFFKIALPVMLSSFVTFLVSFIDNIMVGTVSNEAVSGVYAASQLTYFYNMVIFGALEGAGIFIQQFHGKEDYESERKCFRLKIALTLIYIIIAIPLGFLISKPILSYYCKSDSNFDLILNESMNYFRIVLISFIPFAIGLMFSSTLREIGETKYAMYASLIAVFLNTALNALFIMALQKGVVGAAIATFIARCVEMTFLICISYIKKFGFCTHIFSHFTIDKKLVVKILKKGSLLFINEIGYALGSTLQNMAFSQRDGVLSAISILSTVTNIIAVLIQGISTALGVMVGQDLGKNDFEKAWDDNKKLYLMSMYMSLFLAIILASFSSLIPNMFKEVDSEQKAIATKLILVYSVLLLFNCWSITCYFTLRAGGKTLQTLLLDTGSLLLVYVPIAFGISLGTNWNIIYLYLCVRGLDVLRATVGFILVGKKKWLVNLTLSDERKLEEEVL